MGGPGGLTWAWMRSVRLLHTSDLHIAGGFSTPSTCGHRYECLCPLQAVAALANEHRVDALLLVGDLFDHGRVEEPLFKEALDILAGLPCPTVMICGNHDLHEEDGIFRRYAHHVEGAGITYLAERDGEVVTILDGAVAVWGKAMDDHHPDYRPLHGVPARPEGDQWWVVLGHGHYVGDEPPHKQMRSSPITDDDIAATGADYVALGHWHTLTDASAGGVPAWYAGSPVSSWAQGHAIVIDLVPGQPAAVTAHPVTPPSGGCR